MIVASTLSVFLRFLARRVSGAKYGLDDLCIVIALVRKTFLTYFLNNLAIHSLTVYDSKVLYAGHECQRAYR